MQPNTILRTAWGLVGQSRPVVLYHQPTARCDCRCRFCNFWKDQPKQDDIIPSEKIISMIERAHAAGMTFYTCWGGEPLMAEHLPKWLARAKSLEMITTMCTSGFRLPERAPEIAPVTDQLLLSLEAIGEKHDKLRRTPGLFENVVEGLNGFKTYGRGLVIVWCNLTRDNADQVDNVVKFAKEHGVVVEFFPAILYPGYNDDMIIDSDEREDIFSRIIDYKRQGFPVYNTYYALDLMKSLRPFKCNQCRAAIQIDPKGMLWPCEPKYIEGLEPYGHLDDIDLTNFHKTDAYKNAVEKLSNCNRCRLPTVSNIADNLVTQACRRFSTMLYYRGKQKFTN